MMTAQGLLIKKIGQRWMEVGLSTEPMDVDRCKEGISSAYREVGLDPPSEWVVLGSPHAGMMEEDKKESRRKDIKAKWDRLWVKVRDDVHRRSMEQPGEDLYVMEEKFREMLDTPIRVRIRDQLQAVLRERGPRNSFPFYGQHEAYWLAYVEFLAEAFDSRLKESLNGLILQSQNGGWWWSFPDKAIITDRPCVLRRDEAQRLHSPKGPALGYRDGWGIHAWHGIVIKDYVIDHPERITLKEIGEEENAEMRRILIERFGQDKYIQESGTKVAHQDEFGTLYRKPLNGDEDIVMVKVVNATRSPDGTYKDYFLRVPPDMKTAREAVAWTFDKKEKEYDPMLQA